MKLFEDIHEHMKLSREERRAHLRLDEPCIEIGTDSRLCRGLLAHTLGTTVGNSTIYVCHACHNPNCSNPYHLYWGTPKDNHMDQVENGTYQTLRERTINKHGEKKYLKMQREKARLGGLKGGGNNKLTTEIVKERTKDYKNSKEEKGRITKLAKKWNVSHTQVRRFIETYVNGEVK